MKVYVAEDNAFLRDLLTTHLVDFCSEVEIVGANGNGQIALSECMELKPDIIILDIRLPELSGLDILHHIKEKFPQIKILIYSGLANQQLVSGIKWGIKWGHVLTLD